ncbi:unnamed protein product [Mytilus coruscus]|uniref:Uncharacterized protein n=1 Tax=Mytilus coruscus TaxID=42192 RepID=A0A6J8DNX7_MYTCO|nr:unnamed protein product [Mytilus coruscus]
MDPVQLETSLELKFWIQVLKLLKKKTLKTAIHFLRRGVDILNYLIFQRDRNKTEESETKKDSDTLIADKTRKNYDTVLANKTRKDTESVLSDNSSDSSTKIDHDQPVRRKTTCSTEGKHSNLYKLPKSVLNHNKVQIKENSVLCENKSEYQNVLMKSEKKMINK